MASVIDILRRILGGLPRPPQGDHPVGPTVTTPPPTDHPTEVVVPPAPPSPQPPPVADRYGTFIIPDVYPPDLDDPRTPQLDLPPFQVLPGLTVMDKEVVGCYVKCSQGVGWGATNEDWFRRCWAEMARVRASRRSGTEFRRGCYHFLRFQVDGTRQADYFCDLIESAGGWGEGDLMPWVDVEEGGQGSWAADPVTHAARKLEKITSPAERMRLANEVRACTTAFVSRVKARFPGIRVGLYGRGVFRDLGMTDCRFGCDGVANPAYTPHPPSMVEYGWPLEDMIEWQLCGDGDVAAAGYPRSLPGWGATDYSAYVNGVQRTALSDLGRRAGAFVK